MMRSLFGRLEGIHKPHSVWLTLFRQVELYWTAPKQDSDPKLPTINGKFFVFCVLESIRLPRNSSETWYLPCFSTEGDYVTP
jgi:hypothetical protein